MDGICTPIVPLFCKTVGLSTGLPSIKKNMICGERSSFGDFFSLTYKCRFECRLSVGLFMITPFSGLLFVCLPFSPKRVFPADKHILRYVFVVLNRLDDGLLVTLLTKKVVAAQPLFLIDRHWKYKYLTCQKSAIKSVTKVLNNWFVRIDYAS